jgi:hypothetical protein
LLSARSSIFQPYHGEFNWVTFNKMIMMMSALYKTNTLSLIFIVLTHWNNSSRVDMSLHLGALSEFRVDQSLFSLLNAACLAEKWQISILESLIYSDRLLKSRFTAHEASMLTITPPMLFLTIYKFHVIDILYIISKKGYGCQWSYENDPISSWFPWCC